MAILMLFEYFLSKFCLNFFTLILSALPNVMHFVRTFSICVLLAKGLLLSKRLKIMEKLYTSKTFLIKAGGRRHTPHPAPLDPLLAISYKKPSNDQSINLFHDAKAQGEAVKDQMVTLVCRTQMQQLTIH